MIILSFLWSVLCRDERPAAGGGGDEAGPSRAHLNLDGPRDVTSDAASDVMERSLTSVREGDEREGGEEAVGKRTSTGEIIAPSFLCD